MKNLINIKSLMIYNLIALGLIALLSGSHYFLTNQLIQRSSGDARLINIAGRQRMLSQRLTREVLLLTQSESAQEREDYRRSIAALTAVWTRSHEALKNGDRQTGLLPIGSLKVAATFEKIDQHFNGMRAALREIASVPERQTGNRFAESQPLRDLIAHSNGFLKWMDIAVGQMEAEAVDKIADLKLIVSVTWISVLFLLVLETVFLFLPVALRVRKAHSHLKHSVDQLQNEVALGKEALWRSEKFKSAMLANTSEGIVTMDDSGRVVMINPVIENIFGYSQDEAIGKPVAELFILPHLREQHTQGVKRFLETGEAPNLGKRFEIPAIHKDGSEIEVEMVINAINFDGRYYFTSFLRDITERKRAGAERARLSTALEQVVESIVITDSEGTIQYVNSAFEHNTGFTREEALGQNPRLLSSGRQEPEFYRELWGTIAGGSTWRGSFFNKKKDGTFFEEEGSISPIFNDAGEIINYIAVKRDVTEERNREAQLWQAQKMEAIGVLSGGIAHDFNNILTPILGYTEILRMKLPKDSKVQSYLDAIHEGAMRAKDLVEQILLFSRQNQSERRPMQLNLLAKEVLKLLRSALPKTIEIQDRYDPDLPLVAADATQIHSLLMNLCTNASHAMPDGGVLAVSLQRTVLSEYEIYNGQKISGEFIRLIVADNGEGMDRDTLGRIFDPFFTTKEVGKGTGLGLSTVYGIVQHHSGHIAVESTLGEGAVFEIYLPVSNTIPSSIYVSLPEPTPKGRESVLFIDDEEEIVSTIRLGLAPFGYQVTGFSNPVEALVHLRLNPGKFDLIITDRSMPQMTGEMVARKVAKLVPDLPVILCTGNTENLSQERLEALGIDYLVQKPYSPPDMGRTIRQVMDTARENSLPIHDHPGHSPGQQGSEFEPG